MTNELREQIEDLRAEIAALKDERLPRVDRASKRRDRRQVLGGFGMFAVAILLAGTMSASALAGSNTVTTGDIVDGDVHNSDLGSDSVTAGKVKNGALAGADIKDGSLTGADVAPASIGRDQLATHSCIIGATPGGSVGASCNRGGSVSATHPSAGVYCVDLPVVMIGTVTIDGSVSGFPVAYYEVGAAHGCPSGTDATITTYRLTNGAGAGNVTGTLTDVPWIADVTAG